VKQLFLAAFLLVIGHHGSWLFGCGFENKQQLQLSKGLSP